MNYKLLAGLHIKHKKDVIKLTEIMNKFIGLKNTIRYNYEDKSYLLIDYISEYIEPFVFEVDKVSVFNIPEMIFEDILIKDYIKNNINILGSKGVKYLNTLHVSNCCRNIDFVTDKRSVLPLYYNNKLIVDRDNTNILRIYDSEDTTALSFYIDIKTGDYSIKLKDFDIVNSNLSINRYDYMYQLYVSMDSLDLQDIFPSIDKTNKSIHVYNNCCFVTIDYNSPDNLIIPSGVEKVLLSYYSGSGNITLVFPPTVNEIDFHNIEDFKYFKYWVNFVFSSKVSLSVLESLYYNNRETYNIFPDLESIVYT